jgi:hypothetical protein
MAVTGPCWRTAGPHGGQAPLWPMIATDSAACFSVARLLPFSAIPGNGMGPRGLKWPRQGHRHAVFIRWPMIVAETVRLFGGMADQILGDTWEWDGSVWTQVSDFGATPCSLGCLAFKGDSIALFGGAVGTEKSGAWILSNESTWTWDGKNWTLRQVFGPPSRYEHNLVYDSKRSTLVLFGGYSSVHTQLGDTWEHSEG